MLLLLVSSVLSTLFAFTDLGTYGSQYPIREKNIKTQLEDNFKKHKDDIKALARKAFASGLIYRKSLQFSKEDATYTRDFTMKNPYTGAIIHSSDIPYAVQDNICIVDYRSDKILDEIVKQFGTNCRYVFLNVNITKITSNEKYSKINAFVGNDALFNFFDINATPEKISINGKRMDYQYLNYSRILKELKNKEMESGE